MSDIQALPASGSIIDTYQKLTEKPVIKKEITSRDRIASLANSDSFKEFIKEIDERIEFLSNIPIDPIADTPESVGFRYLASRIAIENLTDLRNLPERYYQMKKDEVEGGE